MITDGRDRIASHLYWGGLEAYEPQEIQLLLALTGSAAVVFDIGANTGIMSLLLSAGSSAEAKVYAFEPVPEIYGMLVRNLEVNGLVQCQALQLAVGNKSTPQTLYVPHVPSIPTSASLNQQFYPDSEAVEVNCVRLDDFAATQQLERVDLVKIDVESRELQVLEGMENILPRFKPKILCEVLCDAKARRSIHDLLKRHAYMVYCVTSTGLRMVEDLAAYTQGADRNFLFIPSSVTVELLLSAER